MLQWLALLCKCGSTSTWASANLLDIIGAQHEGLIENCKVNPASAPGESCALTQYYSHRGIMQAVSGLEISCRQAKQDAPESTVRSSLNEVR